MKAVTVIVSPRERYSSVLGTLREIRQTVPPGTRVILIEGGSPRWVRRKLSVLTQELEVDWVSLPEPVLPNVARNIGIDMTESEYIAFVDNDLLFEDGWLEALVATAERESADAVAPLICIGPPRASIIHHAGGELYTKVGTTGRPVVSERHRLMNVPLEDFDALEAPMENQVCEFHCFVVRTDLFLKIGPLDERLITREQMDFALRCLAVGARVLFEPNSIVTYSARDAFSKGDLGYHLFRWADSLVVKSLDAFESSWSTFLDRERIRVSWVSQHRKRAVKSAFPIFDRLLPGMVFEWGVRALESSVERRVKRMTGGLRTPKDLKIRADELVS